MLKFTRFQRKATVNRYQTGLLPHPHTYWAFETHFHPRPQRGKCYRTAGGRLGLAQCLISLNREWCGLILFITQLERWNVNCEHRMLSQFTTMSFCFRRLLTHTCLFGLHSLPLMTATWLEMFLSLFFLIARLRLSGTKKITPIISLPQQDHSLGQLHPQVLLLITISNQETAVTRSRGRTRIRVFVFAITAGPVFAALVWSVLISRRSHTHPSFCVIVLRLFYTRLLLNEQSSLLAHGHESKSWRLSAFKSHQLYYFKRCFHTKTCFIWRQNLVCSVREKQQPTWKVVWV